MTNENHTLSPAEIELVSNIMIYKILFFSLLLNLFNIICDFHIYLQMQDKSPQADSYCIIVRIRILVNIICHFIKNKIKSDVPP